MTSASSNAGPADLLEHEAKNVVCSEKWREIASKAVLRGHVTEDSNVMNNRTCHHQSDAAMEQLSAMFGTQ